MHSFKNPSSGVGRCQSQRLTPFACLKLFWCLHSIYELTLWSFGIVLSVHSFCITLKSLFSKWACFSLCWTLVAPAFNIGGWLLQRPTPYYLLYLSFSVIFVLDVVFHTLALPVHVFAPMHAAGSLFHILYLALPVFPWFSASDLFFVTCRFALHGLFAILISRLHCI